MLVGFALFTAVASALLDNVTTILLMLPVTIAICEDLGLTCRPFIISQVIASNIGGTATLIGDPPNILIGSATGLNFVDFLVNLGPVVVFLVALMIGGFWLVYGRGDRLGDTRCRGPPDAGQGERAGAHRQRAPLAKIARGPGADDPRLPLPRGVALRGGDDRDVRGVLLLLLSRVDLHPVLAEVEWPTIFFFVGLFILVGGIEKIGLLDRIAQRVVDLTEGDIALTALVLLWFAGIASAIVDNIPAVATLIPLTFAVARLSLPRTGGPGRRRPRHPSRRGAALVGAGAWAPALAGTARWSAPRPTSSRSASPSGRASRSGSGGSPRLARRSRSVSLVDRQSLCLAALPGVLSETERTDGQHANHATVAATSRDRPTASAASSRCANSSTTRRSAASCCSPVP